MKHFKILFALTFVSVLAFSCKDKAAEPEIKIVETTAPEKVAAKTLDPNATYAKAEFTIDGMTCQIGCANTIQSKLSKLDGIKSATVNFDTKLAMVEYDVAKVDAKTLEETVTKAGDMYTVKDMKTVEKFDTTTTTDDTKTETSKTETSKKMTCKGDCEGKCNGDCKSESEGIAMSCSADGKEGCYTTKKA
ncbi:heavy-metal-associated domain-containing protein [Formosa sp. L2A11]|uniref:heavy-metal-associated domain-containing protein n=1 Tax=Formosa sp. L2A11 TaxID=2686363 RepID=UPI00131E83EF|nr:heavy metal-associated domain-containing protein [Formosa sp. L2A11]